jgi:hypothetical protein
MRFLYRRSFCRMLSVLPELLSSVHRPVHRFHRARNEKWGEDEDSRPLMSG